MGISIDIYEESFVKNALPSYNLSALIGADRFSFLGYDQEQYQVQFLKSYAFHSKEKEKTKSLIHQVYNQDTLLKSNFNKAALAINNSKSTLVPNRFFDESQIETYLGKLVDLSQNDVLLINDLPHLDAKNIFALDKGLKTIIEGYFPNAQILHASTLLISGAKELSKHRSGHQVYLNVYDSSLQIVLMEDQELLFCNSYEFKTADDFIYFTLLAFDQFKLKPEAIPLYLSGQITDDSSIYKLMYRYIRHIHFIQLPNFLHFGPRVKNQTSHHYFNLYCSKLCV